VCLNARIVENGAMQCSRAKFKDQNTSNAMVLISPKTTAISGGVARQMIRSTLQGWKQRKRNCVLIYSNV